MSARPSAPLLNRPSGRLSATAMTPPTQARIWVLMAGVWLINGVMLLTLGPALLGTSDLSVAWCLASGHTAVESALLSLNHCWPCYAGAASLLLGVLSAVASQLDGR